MVGYISEVVYEPTYTKSKGGELWTQYWCHGVGRGIQNHIRNFNTRGTGNNGNLRKGKGIMEKGNTMDKMGTEEVDGRRKEERE